MAYVVRRPSWQSGGWKEGPRAGHHRSALQAGGPKAPRPLERKRVTPLGQRLGSKWDCGQSEHAPARVQVRQPREGWLETLPAPPPQCPLQGASGREHAWLLQERAQAPPGRCRRKPCRAWPEASQRGSVGGAPPPACVAEVGGARSRDDEYGSPPGSAPAGRGSAARRHFRAGRGQGVACALAPPRAACPRSLPRPCPSIRRSVLIARAAVPGAGPGGVRVLGRVSRSSARPAASQGGLESRPARVAFSGAQGRPPRRPGTADVPLSTVCRVSLPAPHGDVGRPGGVRCRPGSRCPHPGSSGPRLLRFPCATLATSFLRPGVGGGREHIGTPMLCDGDPGRAGQALSLECPLAVCRLKLSQEL